MKSVFLRQVVGAVVAIVCAAGMVTAAHAQAPIVMTGLSPPAQKIWNQCTAIATPAIRQEVAVGVGTLEERMAEHRTVVEKLSGFDKRRLGILQAAIEDDVAKGLLQAKLTECIINARLAQLDAPATAPAQTAAASQIVMTGLSPTAQALWDKCANVIMPWMRQGMAEQNATADQAVASMRPTLEIYAGASAAYIPEMLANAQKSIAEGKSGGPSESCLANARVAQLVSAAGSQASVAPPAVAAQPGADINGLWRGDSSTNEVTMELQSDGIYVRAVTNNVGQSAPMVYKPAGPGEYRYLFPDGKPSIMQFQQTGVLRLTNPDGWTDVFRIIRKVVR